MDGPKVTTKSKLINELQSLKGIKFQLVLEAELSKQKANREDIITNTRFNHNATIITNEFQIDDLAKEAKAELLRTFKSYMKEGSGWVFDQALKLYLNIAQYQPLRGSFYFDFPAQIVKNDDNKCFQCSILSARHTVRVHAGRVSHYKPYEQELNFDGIEFPVTIDKIPRFETRNNIAVSIFSYEKRAPLFPIYISQFQGADRVNLLLISEGEQSHYCWLKDLNRLLYDQTKLRE